MSVLTRVPPTSSRRVYVVYEHWIEDTILHDAYEDQGDAERDAAERNRKRERERNSLPPASHHFAVATLELKRPAPLRPKLGHDDDGQ